jgi:hypothetical protein
VIEVDRHARIIQIPTQASVGEPLLLEHLHRRQQALDVIIERVIGGGRNHVEADVDQLIDDAGACRQVRAAGIGTRIAAKVVRQDFEIGVRQIGIPDHLAQGPRRLIARLQRPTRNHAVAAQQQRKPSPFRHRSLPFPDCSTLGVICKHLAYILTEFEIDRDFAAQLPPSIDDRVWEGNHGWRSDAGLADDGRNRRTGARSTPARR